VPPRVVLRWYCAALHNIVTPLSSFINLLQFCDCNGDQLLPPPLLPEANCVDYRVEAEVTPQFPIMDIVCLILSFRDTIPRRHFNVQIVLQNNQSAKV